MKNTTDNSSIVSILGVMGVLSADQVTYYGAKCDSHPGDCGGNKCKSEKLAIELLLTRDLVSEAQLDKARKIRDGLSNGKPKDHLEAITQLAIMGRQATKLESSRLLAVARKVAMKSNPNGYTAVPVAVGE